MKDYLPEIESLRTIDIESELKPLLNVLIRDHNERNGIGNGSGILVRVPPQAESDHDDALCEAGRPQLFTPCPCKCHKKGHSIDCTLPYCVCPPDCACSCHAPKPESAKEEINALAGIVGGVCAHIPNGDERGQDLAEQLRKKVDDLYDLFVRSAGHA